MSNRLEILAAGMNPTAKWGCGTVFMVCLVAMVWLSGHYIYNIFWVTTVGTEQYVNALAEIKETKAKLDEFQATNTALSNKIQALETQLTNSNQAYTTQLEQLRLTLATVAAVESRTK